MKIHPSAQGISLAIRALDGSITPALTDKSALAAAEVVRHVLTDLLKRQGPAIKLLQGLIADGEALEKDFHEVTDKKPKDDVKEPLPKDFEGLAERHEELTIRIVDLCSHLSATDNHHAPALLRRAAEWEHAYYAKIPAVQAVMYGDGDENAEKRVSAPALSKDYLEKFLISQKGDLKVSSFAPMTGGHGKQTYVCDVEYEGGKKEEIVVRKMDPAPIVLRSMYLVEQEYFFLKCLSNTDFPCPKPFDLAKKDDGVDGSFFTMCRMPGSGASMFLKTGEKSFSEKMIMQLAELLAKLHATPLDVFAEYFEVYETPKALSETVEERFRRSIQGWADYLIDVQHLPSPYMTWIFDWLKRNVPKDTRRPVPTHGDYSVHNVLVEGDDITAVLDWECADFGCPELDLAYCQPLVSQSMDWEKFLQHYKDCGGQEIRPENFAFCQAYSVLRVELAFNRATYNLQSSLNEDIRFHMVELGYQAVFMGMGLTYTAPSAEKAVEEAPKSNGDSKTNGTSTAAAPGEVDIGGGKTLKVHGDEANVRHKPGPSSNWQESVVLVWWDEENNVGGFHRLGHEPNVESGGVATLWTNLISPEGIFKRTQSIPLREKDLIPNGGFGSGDDTCTAEFVNGEHIWTINDTDTTARIVFKDHGPNVDCFPKKGAMSTEFATAHFDVPGNVSGTLTMKSKTYNIKGLGLRDHAWGPRDWGNTVYSHRWVCGTAGSSFSFVAVAWHSTDDKIANFGWVVRDGHVTLAKSIDLLTYMEMDSCINRGGRVKFTLTTGEVLDVECIAVPAKCLVCYHHDIACVDRICKFTCASNGTSGFANFESSSNIQFGKRRPGQLVGGVIDDGFTPA